MDTALESSRRRRLTTTSLLLLLAFILGLIAVRPEPVHGQQPLPTRTVHVATRDPSASDDNPGTQSEPLKTIARGAKIAEENSAQGVSTSILIHPGTYRESIALRGPEQDMGAAVRFEAVSPGTVTVKGSNVWKDWKRRAGTNIYQHAWPHDWGNAEIPPDWPKEFLDHKDGGLIQRREMVFANGRLLRQVLRPHELNGRRLAFHVDEGRDKIFIKAPARLSPPRARIEVGTRPRLLSIQRQNAVTVEGLNFVHAASPINGNAVSVATAAGVVIRGSRFRWNNWNGLLVVESNDVHLLRNVANNNGTNGMAGVRIRDLVADSNETSHNNWRGWWARFTTWTMGNKFLRLRNARFQDHITLGNKSHGLWIDYDNEDVVVDGLIANGNYGHGLVIDSSQGPTMVRNSKFCRNRHGIFGITSEDVTIKNNVFYNNEVAAIDPSGPSGTRYVENMDTGEQMTMVNEHWVIDSNLIVGKSRKQNLIGTYLDTKHWKRFKNTLTSVNNRYRHPRSRRVFQIARGYGDGYRWPELTFRGWKRHTGEDRSSTFRLTDPRPSCSR